MLYGSGLIDDTFHIDVDLSHEHLDWQTTYMIESTDGITYDTAGANDNIAQEQLKVWTETLVNIMLYLIFI